MKIRFNFIISMIVFCLIAFSSCTNTGESNSLSNLKAIKDFAKYKSIGAGTYSSSSRSARTLDNSITISPTDSAKLVGELEDGSVELVKFIDEDGNTVNQTWYLRAIYIDANFAFLGFSKVKSSVVSMEQYYLKWAEGRYILDLKKGNLYSLDEVFYFEQIGGASFTKDNTSVTFAKGKLIDYQDKFVEDSEGIYTFSIKTDNDIDKLEINKAYPEHYNIHIPVLSKNDRYGNIADDQTIYIKGEISNLEYPVMLNPINNIYYTYDKLYRINEDGQFEENTDNLEVYDLDGNILFNNGNKIILSTLYSFEDEEGATWSTNKLYLIEYTDAEKLLYTCTEYSKINEIIPKGFSITDNIDTFIYAENNIYYKYTWSSNFTDSEAILDVSEFCDSPTYTIEWKTGYIHIYYYDESFNKIEYYIYSNGTVSNSYKDNLTNKVYLTPIA